MIPRLAVHTISWGSEPDLLQMADEIASTGYSGVEIFQDPSLIGGIDQVIKVFAAHGLEVIGICGGTFVDRVNFVDGFANANKKYIGDETLPYIYLDERIDHEVAAKIEKGYRVALHPHMYKPVQTLAEAEVLLKKFTKLLLLPDTAHLYIAGDDPVDAVRRFSNRLAAIHLKNWKRNVGLSYQFYGRGFCELNEGDIELENVLNASHLPIQNGLWIVVEHDKPTDRVSSALKSLSWLNDKLRTHPSFRNPIR